MNDLLLKQYIGLIECNNEKISILANTSAFIMQNFQDISWVGFYLFKNTELILDKGVCGKAASTRKTVIVENVHQFAGHIACDSESNSEIVIPLIKGNQLYGVLDLDSTSFSRFSKEDQIIFEEISKILVQHL